MRLNTRVFVHFMFVTVFCLHSTMASAEQSKQVGDWTVHYSVVNSTFIQPEIAEQYKIVRSESHAVLTLSILNAEDVPVSTPIKGSFKNLLGQINTLTFTKIEEEPAIYYVANFRFVNKEQLRFELEFDFPNGKQKMTFTKKIHRLPL